MKPKVIAGGVAGAIVAVLAWIYGHYQAQWNLPPMTAEIAAALTVIVSTAAGWLKGEK